MKISFFCSGRALCLLLFLAELLAVPCVFSNTVVRFSGSSGDFDMELFDSAKPKTVANFLGYVKRGDYKNSIIHRSVPGFMVQGGGFQLEGNTIKPVGAQAPVINEPGLSNQRGTVAMAKLDGNPDSATNQWFINLGNNAANLDQQNGGFTVFGKVLGNGMDVVDGIAALTTYNATALLGGAFTNLPLREVELRAESLVLFSSVKQMPVGTEVVDVDFSTGANGFSVGFADLPVDYDSGLYALTGGIRPLPAALGGANAMFLSGSNHSDDLWMYAKKKITGLKPNTVYKLTVDLELASNTPAGLAGVGGAPGESVFLKTGGSTLEPVAVVDHENWLRMNIDKGNQSSGGLSASMIGHIAKGDDATGDFARIVRDNRAVTREVASDADGALWLFFGTDSGFEGTTSLYYTRFTAILAPDRPAAKKSSPISGAFVGNFEAGTTMGQLSLVVAKGKAWSGVLTLNATKTSLRGMFDAAGNSTVAFRGIPGGLDLAFETIGLADGSWDEADIARIAASIEIGGQSVSFQCGAGPRPGTSGPLAGESVNALLTTQGVAEIGFGHGYMSMAAGKDGSFKLAGRLADGSALTGSARAARDTMGNWCLPVALTLAPASGFLHGETAIRVLPAMNSGESHLLSNVPWTWVRPALASAQNYRDGFVEKLDVIGRTWKWAKGSSALGSQINCQLVIDADAEVLPEALTLNGTWNPANKPVWNPSPSRFVFKVNPATGIISGNLLPGSDPKTKPGAYQGIMLSPALTTSGTRKLHAGGFVSGTEGSGKLEIVSP